MPIQLFSANLQPVALPSEEKKIQCYLHSGTISIILKAPGSLANLPRIRYLRRPSILVYSTPLFVPMQCTQDGDHTPQDNSEGDVDMQYETRGEDNHSTDKIEISEDGDGSSVSGMPEDVDGSAVPGMPEDGDGSAVPGMPEDGDGSSVPGMPEDGGGSTVLQIIDDILQANIEEEADMYKEEDEARGGHSNSTVNIPDELLFLVQRAGDRLVSMAPQVISNSTSNLAEAFMNVCCKFDGGTFFNRIQRGSFQHRCYGAGLHFQLGPDWTAKVWAGASGSEPGDITKSFGEQAAHEHAMAMKNKTKETYKDQRKKSK